jgi:hypothetical protein
MVKTMTAGFPAKLPSFFHKKFVNLLLHAKLLLYKWLREIGDVFGFDLGL